MFYLLTLISYFYCGPCGRIVLYKLNMFYSHKIMYIKKKKINNRKVQGVPQSQAAANLRHKEEEKKAKNQRV